MPRITIDNSPESEGIDASWWVIIDTDRIPALMQPKHEQFYGGRDSLTRGNAVDLIAHSVTGPWFSREGAEKYLKSHYYKYSKDAVVYCMGSYNSRQHHTKRREAGRECQKNGGNLLSVQTKQFLRPKSVEAEFDVDIKTLEKWRSDGFGPTYSKCGRIIWYDRADVVRWIESNKVKTN